MGFLQIHIIILCLTLGYYDDHETRLGREDRKLSENVGDRYEAIGEMQEKHMLTPGWFNSFEKEHPISQPWRHKRHERRERERRPRSHHERRSRSHRHESSRHLKDQMRNYDRRKPRRHRHREENHHSSDGRRPLHRKSSEHHSSDHYSSNGRRPLHRKSSEHYSSDGRPHHHHREKNTDNAGNYNLPTYHSKSRKIEKETGFHSQHKHHRKVSTKKMFGTQVHWVPNMFAESSVKKIQKAENTCDCSKCAASPKPAAQKSVQDQPEIAAAVSLPEPQAVPKPAAQQAIRDQPEVAAAVSQPEPQAVANTAVTQPMAQDQPEVAAAAPQSVPQVASNTAAVQQTLQVQPEAILQPAPQMVQPAVQNQPEVAAAASQSALISQSETASAVPPPSPQIIPNPPTSPSNLQPEIPAASMSESVPAVPPPLPQMIPIPPTPPSKLQPEIPAASMQMNSNIHHQPPPITNNLNLHPKAATPQVAPPIWPQAQVSAPQTQSIWPDSPPQAQVGSLVKPANVDATQWSMRLKRRRELALAENSFSQDDVLEFGSRDVEDEREVSNNGCPDCCKEKQSGWSKPEVSVGYHIEEP